eukprot:CAMPEP_0171386766 /NCGR_PEP_ID=MMETSP0879-20121228/39660_1 /TAXON_ID=67004 /ORGANISM="Thalassiosira weissflogii, Strain CCMP1336" /LENGTH=256 /DNA_ID=CAMNT_0011899085 /DNA_START=110 /DNA_END=877 /DNA_ORIENTATION=-
MYQCRMRYLRSREGGARHNRSRRKGSTDVLMADFENEAPQLPGLNKKLHGPCSPEILRPPAELMTRAKAFRHAYWEYHCEPTTKRVKKLQFAESTDRERFNVKRQEIWSKIKANERSKREAEIRQRAEMVINQALNYQESDESDSETTELTPISMANQSEIETEGVTPPQDDTDDDSTVKTYSKTCEKMAVSTPSPLAMIEAGSRSKRHHAEFLKERKNSRSSGRDKVSAEDDIPDNSIFSFLTDWTKMEKRRIRW